MKAVKKRQVRAPQAAPVRAPLQTTADLPDLPQMYLGGRFARDVMVIPRSNSSIILASAQVGETKTPVLVPFVELQFQGVKQGDLKAEIEPDDLGTREIFSETLSLENTFWLIFDMMRDVRVAINELKDLTGNPTAFESARIAHARHFADQVRLQAEMCVLLLDDLAGPSAEAAALNEVPEITRVIRVPKRSKSMPKKSAP